MSAFIKDWIPLIEDYYYCETPDSSLALPLRLTQHFRHGYMNITTTPLCVPCSFLTLLFLALFR